MISFICLFIISLPQENGSPKGNISILFISVFLVPNGMPGTEQAFKYLGREGKEKKERKREEVGDSSPSPHSGASISHAPGLGSLHHLLPARLTHTNKPPLDSNALVLLSFVS